ncbi:MAG: hypothetical protein RL748_3622 [Pseudomonadota bacterium]
MLRLNNMKINSLKYFSLGILFFFFSVGVNAMGFSKVLFSKVHGVVVKNGKPVSDAVVTRHFNFGWTDEEKTESTKTGKDGSFDFPIITRFSMATSLVPHEPSVSQTIKIQHEGKEYIAWHLLKRNYDDNGELGKPINLICELTREPDIDPKTKVAGICSFQ